MSLDSFGSRCSVFVLLVLGWGFALVLSSCAGQPSLGQVPGTPRTATVTTNPASKIPGTIPNTTQLTSSNPTTEAWQTQVTAQSTILYGRQGTVIARGQALKPTSLYHLKSYDIEEVDLPEPALLPVPVRNSAGIADHIENMAVDRFWRLRVYAEPGTFIMTSLPWIIWANDTMLDWSSSGGEGLAIIVFNSQLLPEGAYLGVSHGVAKAQDVLPIPIHYIKNP